MIAKRNVQLACVLALGCCVGAASAGPAADGIGPDRTPPGQGACPPGLAKQGRCVKAPEIDAAAGVQAIALLSGILLLVGERSRSRRG